MTFTTLTSDDGSGPGGRRMAGGVDLVAVARGLAEVRVGAGLRVAAGRVAVGVRTEGGEVVAAGRVVAGGWDGVARLGRAAGVAAGEVAVGGAATAAGVGGRPVRASATGRLGYGASMTSARSTSRTPNQARQIDRAVAPHQIARYPTTRRMR
ncbi:hypothetical protein GCM10010106_40170 [Thermopolyspora flexuosa]|nr:hypothetical protein GCM10010106_40170 [Thermopolyspora flexuosa]